MAVEHPHRVEVLQSHQQQLHDNEAGPDDQERQAVQQQDGPPGEAPDEAQAGEGPADQPREGAPHVKVAPKAGHLHSPGQQDAQHEEQAHNLHQAAGAEREPGDDDDRDAEPDALEPDRGVGVGGVRAEAVHKALCSTGSGVSWTSGGSGTKALTNVTRVHSCNTLKIYIFTYIST